MLDPEGEGAIILHYKSSKPYIFTDTITRHKTCDFNKTDHLEDF